MLGTPMADSIEQIYQRYPATLQALVSVVVLAAIFWWTGALLPSEVPEYANSALQMTGMSLMLIAVPTYMLAAWTIGHRRSLELLAELRPQLPDSAAIDTAEATIRTAWRRTFWIGSAVGIGLSLFNTQPWTAILETAYPRIAVPISIGQMFLWWIIGMLMLARMTASNAFAQLGEQVPVDVFRLDRLRPLARTGIVDGAIVVGALALAPLQSLDAEFRLENYLFALTTGIPSLAFFLVWPLRRVHLRIRADRDVRLANVDDQIEALGGALPATREETERLELLLAHRERLVEARTWPLDLRLLSRVVFYLIIPPLAWVAAAVVERIVDATLAG